MKDFRSFICHFGIVVCLLFFGYSAFSQTPKATCDSLIESGIKLMLDKDYQMALEKLTKGHVLAKKHDWPKQDFLALNNLGLTYYAILEYGEALDHYLKAYQIALKKLSPKEEMTVFNNIGIVYSEEEKYNKAKRYFSRAYDIAISQNNAHNKALYAINLGILNNRTGNFQMAKSLLKKALGTKSIDSSNREQARVALAKSYFNTGRVNRAETLITPILKKEGGDTDAVVLSAKIEFSRGHFSNALDKLKRLLGKTSDLNEQKRIYHEMAIIYAQLGENAKVISAKNKELALAEKINAKHNNRLLENSKVKLDIQHFRQQLGVQEKRLTDQKELTWVIVGFSTGILLLLTWIFKINYSRQKQRKAIAEHRTKMARLELAEQEKEKEKLKKEVELANKELATKALFLSDRNTLINSVVAEIEQLPNFSGTSKMRRLTKSLKQKLHTDKEWDSFFVHFEKVNNHVLTTLQKNHPNLSQNDLRFLAYTYMNLNTKEIALILNITPAACRKRRERIRKKMGLSQKTGLFEYMFDL